MALLTIVRSQNVTDGYVILLLIRNSIEFVLTYCLFIDICKFY